MIKLFSQSENQRPEQTGNRKKVLVIFLVLGAALLIGGFIFALAGNEEESALDDTAQLVRTENGREVIRTEDGEEDEGPLYEFFAELFGGINEGLQEGAAESAGRVSDVEMQLGGTGEPPLPAIGTFPKENENIPEDEFFPNETTAQVERTYLNEVETLLGSPVRDETGDIIGELLDIFVESGTGTARGIVVGSGIDNRMIVLPYELILQQNTEEGTILSIDSETLASEPAFNYGPSFAKNTIDISLRLLRNSAIRDLDGNNIGRVTAIIFEDALVENIIFTVRSPNPEVPGTETVPFELTMRDVTLVRNPDGYSIRLSEEQTSHIASLFLSETARETDSPE